MTADGEYELLGIEINDIGWLRDEDLVAIDQLDLARVDLPDYGLFNVAVSDALSWARETFPSRYTEVPA